MYLFALSPNPQDLSGEAVMGPKEGPVFPSLLPPVPREVPSVGCTMVWIRTFVLGISVSLNSAEGVSELFLRKICILEGEVSLPLLCLLSL